LKLGNAKSQIPVLGLEHTIVLQVVFSLFVKLHDTVQLCNHDQVIKKGWARRSCSRSGWHLLCFTWE